ncbi:cell division protein ZapA [Pseudomonadota bacterium]
MVVNLQASVGRNKYDLSCEEHEQEKIVELTRRLNKRVNLISMNLGRVSDVILLFIAGISIQRELDIARKKISGTFYNYLIQSSKNVNNILPAKASLDDKDERERLFISCLNLENELYLVSNGEKIDYLQQEKSMPKNNKAYNNSNSDNSEPIEFQNQVKDIIDVFEELTSSINKLSIKIKNC